MSSIQDRYSDYSEYYRSVFIGLLEAGYPMPPPGYAPDYLVKRLIKSGRLTEEEADRLAEVRLGAATS